MIVLVPILSGRENSQEFISRLYDASKVFLLIIIDREFALKTSSAVSELMQARKIVLDIEEKLKEKNIPFDELTEWGQTIKKIFSICVLKKIDKVVLLKQNNVFFNEIVSELEKEKINIEVVDV